jgi:hypothetical protein
MIALGKPRLLNDTSCNECRLLVGVSTLYIFRLAYRLLGFRQGDFAREEFGEKGVADIKFLTD